MSPNYLKVNSIMGVQKPRKDASSSQALRYPMLEEQLIQLFVGAMEEAELRPSKIFWLMLQS